jgi:hypothetical protein
MILKTLHNKINNLKLNKKQNDYLNYCYNSYDIELQSLNELLIKKRINISNYNKSVIYNNNLLKKELLKLIKGL